MATAVEYRKLAEECFQWAREALDESVREHYASLGRIWLECAARTEVRSGIISRFARPLEAHIVLLVGAQPAVACRTHWSD